VLLFLNSHEISYVVFRSRMWYTVPQLQKCHTLQEPPIFSTHLEVMLSLCMSSLSISLSLFRLLICLLVCLSPHSLNLILAALNVEMGVSFLSFLIYLWELLLEFQCVR
jgi:hypothetical protein